MRRFEQRYQAAADIRIGKELYLNAAVLIVVNGNVLQSAADTDLRQIIQQGEGFGVSARLFDLRFESGR